MNVFRASEKMIKSEKTFVSMETNINEIQIGHPVILVLSNGNRIKTSAVENWTESFNRELKIVTRNTIYRKQLKLNA